MLDHEIRALCRKLKPVLGRRADSLWLAYAMAETLDGRREAESLIQMSVAKHLDQSVDETAVLLPPPSRAAAFKLTGPHVIVRLLCCSILSLTFGAQIQGTN
jgi:hypothetical protein